MLNENKIAYPTYVDNFVKNHHGQFVKLTDSKNHVFGYVFRCEAKENDKKLLVFSIIPTISYVKFKPQYSKELNKIELKTIYKNLTEVKLFGIKRVLSKWKKVKENCIFKYDDLSDDTILINAENCLNDLKITYKNINEEFLLDIKRISEYILKEFRAIKKYYKETSEIKIIFL